MRQKNKDDISISNLLRGNTALLVLGILKNGSSHGYGITHEIAQRSADLIKFKQATLYPLLHDLEKEGLITSEWELSGAERPRRMYSITELGSAELQKRLKAFHEFSNAVYNIAGLEPNEGTG